MNTYKRLTTLERVQIEYLLSQGYNKTAIAYELNRSTSTITREVNYWVKHPNERYKSQLADSYALDVRHYPRNKKFDNVELQLLIKKYLKKRWSPQQISNQLKQDYQEDKKMQVSHELIYRYIYVWAKGELRKELIEYLRQQKPKRKQVDKLSKKEHGIKDRIFIDDRPKEVEERLIPGHWESDLIIGKDNKSAIGTLVERKTRFVIIVKLPNKSARAVTSAFARELRNIPGQMRLSLTHDNGSEMAKHKLLTEKTKVKVYFAHPYSSWERGTNENTNGLIRDFFPKGTDFGNISKYKLKKVQDLLNERPRKVLNWKNPTYAYYKELENLNTQL
jgi:IS30 family transposase